MNGAILSLAIFQKLALTFAFRQLPIAPQIIVIGLALNFVLDHFTHQLVGIGTVAGCRSNLFWTREKQGQEKNARPDDK